MFVGKTTDSLARRLQACGVVALLFAALALLHNPLAAADGIGNPSKALQSLQSGPESDSDDVYWDDQFDAAGVNGEVNRVAVDAAGHVYIGGKFTQVGNVSAFGIAKWDGTSWSSVGHAMPDAPTSLTQIRAIAIHGSDLYAGGRTESLSYFGDLYLAKWNGSSWFPLISEGYGSITAVAATGNEVYAADSWASPRGMSGGSIMKWDGTTWTLLAGGLYSYASALVTSGTDLYAGGDFYIHDGSYDGFVQCAKWDGTTWTKLGSNVFISLRDLEVSGGELYAAGSRFVGGSQTCSIAKFDGTTWTQVGAATNLLIESIALNGGKVYAGGWFTTAGEVLANHVAVWNGTAWAGFGSGTDNLLREVAVSRNTLFVGGLFEKAGGKTSRSFAVLQPRVNLTTAGLSAVPGVLTIGNDVFGFYKPSLMTGTDTTVTYPGGSLPTEIIINRADEIHVGGRRINGAFSISPEGLQFGGDGAVLRVEFSEDDVALFGDTYSNFRIGKLTYPADYPNTKEAAGMSLLDGGPPIPVRIENGRQIYALTVPIAEIASTYGAVPQTLFRRTLEVAVIPQNSGFVTADPPPGADGKYGHGTVVNLTAVPLSGFAFSSWDGPADGSSNPVTVTMNEDTTVTALFLADLPRFTIMLSVSPAEAGSIIADPPPSDDGKYSSGTVVVLTPVPTVGYLFSGWSGEPSNCTEPAEVVVDKDLAVTAEFGSVNAPNLTGTWAGAKLVGRAAKILKGRFIVRNNGSENAGAFLLRVYRTRTGRIDAESTLVTSRRIRSLKAGRSKLLRVHGRVPAGAEVDGLRLVAVVDADQDVSETTECDNTVVSASSGADR